MILAAGRGERMRPLTDTTPKALLAIGGRMLIEHHIAALAEAGIGKIVVNHAHLGNQITEALGDGKDYGVELRYSPEGDKALETGGGIVNALALLGNNPFIVVNADVWTAYPFSRLAGKFDFGLAHLVLVDNPAHNLQGDFCLDGIRITSTEGRRLTYSGIAVFRPAFFANCTPGRYPLAPLLARAISENCVSGEYYPGLWIDVGTVERLREAREIWRRSRPQP